MDETLAAFADGRLNAYGRAEVIEHLAACDDCRVVFDTIADAQDAGVIEREGGVVRGNFGRNATIATLAAAAAVAVVLFTPPVQQEIAFRRTGGVSALVAAAAPLRERDFEGRLGGEFPYKPLKPTNRAGGETTSIDTEKLPLLLAQNKIAQRESDSPKHLRAMGLAHLLVGERDEAIASLERALQLAGGNDPRIMSDLAAAYLAKSRFLDDKAAAKHALDLAVRAWQLQKTPEIAWNRALAYQSFGDRTAALAAWQDYLALDPSSPWAAEVREKHIPDLQDPLD